MYGPTQNSLLEVPPIPSLLGQFSAWPVQLNNSITNPNPVTGSFQQAPLVVPDFHYAATSTPHQEQQATWNPYFTSHPPVGMAVSSTPATSQIPVEWPVNSTPVTSQTPVGLVANSITVTSQTRVRSSVSCKHAVLSQ